MKKEKIFNVLVYLLMFIAVLSTIISEKIADLDEVWNYSFARNIANGLIPYRDFNIIITPLVSMICGLILKITLDELIIMRILGAILCSSTLYIIYKVFSILDIKKEISFILTFIIGWFLKDYYALNYNFASLFIALVIIYKELKVYKKDLNFIKVNIKEDIILGILAGLAITIKQTSGILICLVLLGNKLLFVKNKESFKIYLKSFAYRILGFLIPVLVFLAYLIINEAFIEFIDYTIKGISKFSNNISYKELFNFDIVGILSILAPVAIICVWIETVILEKNKLTYIILAYGLAIFALCFPISDKGHFSVSVVPILIIILYRIYNISYEKIYLKISKHKILINRIVIILLSTTILVTICFTVANFIEYIKLKDQYSNFNHFRFLPISEENKKVAENLVDYIKLNDNVKIIDVRAAFYMIPCDKYNKDYDMINVGNLGVNGEERIIKEISESKDTTYLVLKTDFRINWQTPLNIVYYIKNNKTKVGDLEIYDIYK